MKWYCAKKYKPILSSKVFVITQNKAIWTADYAFDHNDDEEANAYFISDMTGTILPVTHFCIPDPVEIDNEMA